MVKARPASQRAELQMARQLRGKGGQIGGLEGGLRASSLDAGEVEKGVDELKQPQSASLGDIQPAALNLRADPPTHPRAPPAGIQALKSAVCGTRG